MNIQTFDPKTPWPKPDPDFHICAKHSKDKVMVTYRSDECPLCSAEKRVVELERINKNPLDEVESLEARIKELETVRTRYHVMQEVIKYTLEDDEYSDVLDLFKTAMQELKS